MKKTVYIPCALVHMHMARLAALPYHTSHSIRVQLVLLPPHASDVTPETPEVEVIELTQGVTVRKNKSYSDSGTFSLAGLALTSSKPAVKGYYVRGVRVLGDWYVQVLCSPELPPEVLAAKEAQEKKRLIATRQTKRSSQRLQQPTADVARAPSTPTAAPTIPPPPPAALAVEAAPGSGSAAGRPPRRSAAAIAAAVRTTEAVAATEAHTDGPYQAVLQQMAVAVCLPKAFVDASMP
eukprot:gene9127-9296_t